MVACFSCHSLCEEYKTYYIFYGSESLETYAPGDYSEYNKKAISEQVLSEEVSICSNCINKKKFVNKYKYAIKLWSESARHPQRAKSCSHCYHISETRLCSHYKYKIPWWISIFISTDKMEPTIDLRPVMHMIYCGGWKPQSYNDKNASDSLINRFRMGFYLIKYHKKIRKNLKSFLFQDLFSLGNFIDEIQGFLNSNPVGNVLGQPYYYLIFKPYSIFWETNIYKKYCDTRAKIKDWAEILP